MVEKTGVPAQGEVNGFTARAHHTIDAAGVEPLQPTVVADATIEARAAAPVRTIFLRKKFPKKQKINKNFLGGRTAAR